MNQNDASNMSQYLLRTAEQEAGLKGRGGECRSKEKGEDERGRGLKSNSG